MAITKVDLLNLVRNTDHGDVDFLREGVRLLAQALMDAEVSEQIGADHGERNPDGRSALDQLLARVPDCGMRQVDVSPRDRVRYRSSSDTT